MILPIQLAFVHKLLFFFLESSKSNNNINKNHWKVKNAPKPPVCSTERQFSSSPVSWLSHMLGLTKTNGALFLPCSSSASQTKGVETKLSALDSSESQRCISYTGSRFVLYSDSQRPASEGDHAIKPALNGQKNDSSVTKAGKWCVLFWGLGYGPDECQCDIELFQLWMIHTENSEGFIISTASSVIASYVQQQCSLQIKCITITEGV